MHPAALDFVSRCVRDFNPTGPVFEIGSRNVNGSTRSLFRGVPYFGIDLRPGPDVDHVADGRFYTPPISPRTVICCEVLEHCPTPDALVRHAAGVLAIGGFLIITAADIGRAQHSGIDGGPLRAGEHYAGIPLGLIQRAAASRGVRAIRMVATGQDVHYVGERLAIFGDG